MSILFDKRTGHSKVLRSIAMVGIGALVLSGALSGVPTALAETGSQTTAPATAPAVPAAPQADPAGSSLVPKPVQLTAHQDQPGFILTPDVKIVAGEDLTNEANVLASALRGSTGFEIPVVAQADPSDHAIRLVKGAVAGAPASHQKEAYSLLSNEYGVTITGVEAHGVFNGSMTLLQLLPGFIHMKTPVVKDWVVPAVEIKDWPRYEYRGMMLDIARSFVPKNDIKKLIDTLSQYKISALHLHLADDQGWRIEITNDGRAEGDTIDYTRLTGISGKTAVWPNGAQTTRETGRTGFLTQKDYKEIQAYAAAHHVIIVPEIDLPGHTNAALHAIPELNTAGSSHEGTKAQPTAPANGTGGVGYSYLDPNAEASKTFIKHVLKQIAAMTTAPYMHIGGDEPHKMTERYGEHVYNSFLGEILAVVHDLHKTPIGWNEIAQAQGLTEGDVMHFWRGNAAVTRAAVKNHKAKVLLSQGNTSYIDQKYNSKTPLALTWACNTNDCDFKHYYKWNPRTFIGLNSDDGILGTEAPLWSETVRGLDQVEFLTFNRTLSHAEIGWTPQNQRESGGFFSPTIDANDFASRVSQIGVDLNATGSNFYDGTDGTWAYDVAGVKSVATAANGEFQLGYLSAPGTKVSEDGLRVKADTVNDADGISRSLAPAEGLQVMVNWGDGSAAEAAKITSTLPRSSFNASGMYVLTASHQFAEAGQHEVTLTAGNRTAKAIINVDAAGNASKPLFTPWAPTGDPALKLGQKDAKVLDRVEFSASGFKPNTLAQVYLGEGDNKVSLVEIRPDADGTRHTYLYLPANIPAGVYTMHVEQGDRTATAPITIWAPKSNSPMKSPVQGLTVADKDSEETVGETAPNGPAAAAIDGKRNTYWHTKWKNGEDPFPHHISLNLNKSCMVSGLEYTPRQDVDNTRIKDYEIYTSVDGTNWGTAVKTGRFDASKGVKYVGFDAVKANYVKLVGLNSQNGQKFGGAAEIRIDGICGTPFASHIGEGEAAVELSGDSENPTAVKVTDKSEVTVSLSGINFAGQATLWTDDNHQIVTHTEVTAGKDATLSFTAKPELNGKRFELITPKHRRYFVLQVKPILHSVMRMAKADTSKYPIAQDITVKSMFAGEIDWMLKNRYSTGYADGTYRPLGSVNRDAMAAFLYRLAGSPQVDTKADGFKDVPRNDFFAKEITWMKQSGISTGWDDGTYRPLEPVSREAMAAFLYRFCDQMPDKCASAINPDNLKVSENPGFKDVPASHQFAKPIAWLATAKVSTGWPDQTFRPGEPIHRDAMAAFLYRLKNNYLEEVE